MDWSTVSGGLVNRRASSDAPSCSTHSCPFLENFLCYKIIRLTRHGGAALYFQQYKRKSSNNLTKVLADTKEGRWEGKVQDPSPKCCPLSPKVRVSAASSCPPPFSFLVF